MTPKSDFDGTNSFRSLKILFCRRFSSRNAFFLSTYSKFLAGERDPQHRDFYNSATKLFLDSPVFALGLDAQVPFEASETVSSFCGRNLHTKNAVPVADVSSLGTTSCPLRYETLRMRYRRNDFFDIAGCFADCC